MNILLIDDEKRACTNLKNILVRYVDPALNIAGIAHNTKEAEKKIQELRPDAVFLDIEMPNENAFHFLERITPFNFEIVFVTSYDEYAIKAFRLNAVDYILKPISINELKNAVNKLYDRVRYKNVVNKDNSLYTQLSDQVNNHTTHHKITLKYANGVEIINFKDICFIEAQSSYSRIVFLKENIIKEIVMSNPLADYEELLPADLFYRIHRSYLVNCSLVKKVFSDDSHKALLNNDIILPISRRRYTPLLDFMKTMQNYSG